MKCIKQFHKKPSSSTPTAFCVDERIIEHKQHEQKNARTQWRILPSSPPDIIQLEPWTQQPQQKPKTKTSGLEKPICVMGDDLDKKWGKLREKDDE